MRIPMGDFGNAVARPQRAVNLPDMPDVGAHLVQVGGMGQHAVKETLAEEERKAREAAQEAKQRQREAKQESDALIRARAANALLDHEIQLKTAGADIEERLADGRLRHDQAGQAYAEAVKGIQPSKMEGMDPVTAENFDKGVKRLEFGTFFGVQRAAEKAKRAEFKGQTDLALDQLGKLAGMPGSNIDEINGKADALDQFGQAAYGQNWAKTKQDFKDRNWLNHATQRAMESRDSLPAIRALEKDLTDTNGFYSNRLDTEKRNAVLRTVLNDRARIEARIQHDADRREAKAERAVKELTDITLDGFTPSPEKVADAEQIVSGTALGDALKNWKRMDAYVQKFIYAHPQAMQNELTRVENLIRTEGATKENISMLKNMETLYNNTRKAISDDPIRFAGERRLADIQPLDMQTSGLKTQLRARLETAYAMRKQYGAPLKVFTSEEATALGEAIDKGDMRAKRDYLTAISEGIGDKAALPVVLAQVAQKNPVIASAGVHLAGKHTTTDGKPVADYILKGQDLIDKKEITLPKPADRKAMEELFDDETKGIFVGKESSRQVFMDTAMAIYAARSAEEGEVSSGDYTRKRWKSAIALATGGVVEFNDARVIPPYGMKPEVFETKAKAALQQIAAGKNYSSNLSAGAIMSMELENDGDGSYKVRKGGKYLLDRKGQPITFRISP